ncbi:MAG TPA: metalloregulator ArsR/SmtB family transcription factor [Pyrinomonadaceae bacterium]|jgi:ArsR family transcriptional regulator
MNSENNLLEMENLFLALSDKTRLRLLNLMRGGEVCVCFFSEVLGESQPKVSRHLAYLRNAGIVSTRRDGKWVHYQIEHPSNSHSARILEDTLKWLKEQGNMQADYEKLIDICCSADSPVTLIRAPKPGVSAETVKPSLKKEELETFLL